MPPETGTARPTLDDFVAAFEAARAAGTEADLADFLPAPEHPLHSAVLCELVRVDLEYRWSHGRPLPLEDYQRRFPGLFLQRDALRAIAFEEYRLRRQAGQAPAPAEYQQRFGIDTTGWPGTAADPAGWRHHPAHDPEARSDVGAAGEDSWGDSGLDEHVLLPSGLVAADLEGPRLAHALDSLPAPGSRFLGFRLLAELGRGTFGRVYLAQQGDLANRLVALKISVDLLGESQTLAQLQHTNIVPVYSVHQAGPLQAVCMPYFGPTTLADVLHDLRRQPAPPTSGRDLVLAVRARQERLRADLEQENDIPPVPEGLSRLGEMEYVQAILWLAVRLAEGLAHAHERGILHRDLKPANVLLTDEGQPMLLDFNLSADVKARAPGSASRLGGTLPYMAPEHLAAFAGQTNPVDARSDLYALGVILFELLTSRPPFPLERGALGEVLPRLLDARRRGAPLLRSHNRAISPAVESIVRHLLEPEPARRYQSAQELCLDLRRQLDSLPLCHALEPSVRERLSKWTHRHPRLGSPVTISALLLAAAFALGGLLAWQKYHEVHHEKVIVQVDLARTRGDLTRLHASLEQQRRRGEVHAVQALCDLGPGEPGEDNTRCRALLHRYGILDNPSWQETPEVQQLSPDEREQLRQDAGELLYLLARSELLRLGQADLAGPLHEPAAFGLPVPRVSLLPFDIARAALDTQARQALGHNRQAEGCYAEGQMPRALLLQRAALFGLLTEQTESDRFFAQAEQTVPCSPRDSYLSAYEYAARGEFERALPLAEAARREEPGQPAVWLLLGLCSLRRGEFTEAIHCCTVAEALHPGWFLACHNRGLAYLAQKNWTLAREDFDRVLAARPGLPEGHVCRAAALLGLKRPQDALLDLRAAVQHGYPAARLAEDGRWAILRGEPDFQKLLSSPR
jgi:serine/threonine protein kinase/tetratricopeptide (TPR) repeat protein